MQGKNQCHGVKSDVDWPKIPILFDGNTDKLFFNPSSLKLCSSSKNYESVACRSDALIVSILIFPVNPTETVVFRTQY